MNAGAALCDELADGRVGAFGLEELHERVAGANSGDASTVRVVEGLFRESEQVAVQGENVIEGIDGDADVSDTSAT
jgi:hypothetical protein